MPNTCQTVQSGRVFVSKSVEVAALDVLYRTGWKPVTRDAVVRWFGDRSRHGLACPCWRCTGRAKINAGSGLVVSGGLAANDDGGEPLTLSFQARPVRGGHPPKRRPLG